MLANNHVLDFGYEGLAETLQTLQRLRRAGLQTAGAGWDLGEARRPAVINLPAGGRVVVVSVAARSSGVPEDWAAASERPGVDVLPDLSASTAAEVAARIAMERRPGDIAVVSIHWGSNWGYERCPRTRFGSPTCWSRPASTSSTATPRTTRAPSRSARAG